MRSKALYIAFITVVLLALCLVVFAMTVDVDAAEADPDCFHGCPPILRPFKAFGSFLSQCAGPWCGQEHSGPPDGEPVR